MRSKFFSLLALSLLLGVNSLFIETKRNTIAAVSYTEPTIPFQRLLKRGPEEGVAKVPPPDFNKLKTFKSLAASTLGGYAGLDAGC